MFVLQKSEKWREFSKLELVETSEEYEKVYRSAMRILGIRMHSCRELGKKLESKKYEQKDIAGVIREFLELGYLDDIEYAKSYIHASQLKLKGKRRIEKELREKGIRDCDIEMAFENLKEDAADEAELDRALKLAEKGFALSNIKHDFDDVGALFKEKKRIREKLTRKLIAKGFSMEITYKAVENVLKINTETWKN